MIHLGQLNTLEILRETPPGLFLGDDEGNEISKDIGDLYDENIF